MPAEDFPLVTTLVEVGRRTVNVAYLILSEKVGMPEPCEAVEITLLRGEKFRLEGGDAREWLRKLGRFVPGDDDSGTLAGKSKVVRRKKRAAEDL